MNRDVPASPHDELVAAALAIYSLPRNTSLTDAFASMPGQGETIRESEAIRAWQLPDREARFLLIAGPNLSEKTAEPLTIKRLSEPPYQLSETDGLLLGPNVTNTKEQTEWIAEQVKSNQIKSIALFITPYHLLRAYMTLLKSLLKRDCTIPIYPIPVDTISTVSPESSLQMWQMVAGEARRILAYQEKGDVASFEELKQYLKWLNTNGM